MDLDSTLHNTFCSQTQCFVTSGSALTNITRIVGLRADKDYALFWWNKICPPHLSFAHCCQVSTYFLANLRKKFSKMQNPYGHRNFFANSYFLRPLLKYLAEFSATWQQCFCHESDRYLFKYCIRIAIHAKFESFKLTTRIFSQSMFQPSRYSKV